MTLRPESSPRSRGFSRIFGLLGGLFILTMGFGSIGCVAAQKQVQDAALHAGASRLLGGQVGRDQRRRRHHGDHQELRFGDHRRGLGRHRAAGGELRGGAGRRRGAGLHLARAGRERATPARTAAQMLQNDPTLELGRHLRVPEQPPECGVLKKKYTIVGEQGRALRRGEPAGLAHHPAGRQEAGHLAGRGGARALRAGHRALLPQPQQHAGAAAESPRRAGGDRRRKHGAACAGVRGDAGSATHVLNGADLHPTHPSVAGAGRIRYPF